MAPASSVPAALISYLSGPQTSTPEAIDALEEYILHRRTKGDTLFDVSVGLAELEDRVSFAYSLLRGTGCPGAAESAKTRYGGFTQNCADRSE